MHPTYGLHGKLTAMPGHADQLARILQQAAQLMAVVAGCHLYLVSKDATTPNAVWVTEIWDSKADHDASLSLPGVRELIGQALPLLDGQPSRGQELEILGGHGIPQ
ncbi:MAG: antibiotic biosynthesis monooxygenase [Phaeodactylibacter sp.]|nr:antibiotic biosynthesis monooxygenase [Phaeodactylibacter sp.]